MISDAATTPTPAPQPAAPQAAPGPQSAPASPAPQPTPVQLLWEVAYLAFGLMTRLVHVLRPIQQYYPKPALLLARLLIDIPRIMLTIRFAPERITHTQLRHLTRARHLLQALFNYTLPLEARTSSSASATANQSPSASTENATPLGARTSRPPHAIGNQHPTPSPNSPSLNPSSSATPGARKPSSTASTTPSIREVPEIPMVAGVSHVPASPTVDRNPLTPDPSQSSQSANNNSAFRIQHSAFSPFVPDVHTLLQALKADSLPPNCAGALFEEPGEALVRALHQLHTIYFSLYPNQSPSPSNPQSAIYNPQSAPSPSQSSVNLQSSICNPQSDAPSVHSVNPVNHVNPVHSVHSVHPVHSPSQSQSEISNLKSEIPNPDSSSPHSAFPIPHSSAPP